MEQIISTFPPTKNEGGGQIQEREDNSTRGSVPSEEPQKAQGTEIEEERLITEEDRAIQTDKNQREAGV